MREQHQHRGRRDALDEGAQHLLRLGIDPVEILDRQGQRTPLAQPQQQRGHRLDDAAAALMRRHGRRLGIAGIDRQHRPHEGNRPVEAAT